MGGPIEGAADVHHALILSFFDASLAALALAHRVAVPVQPLRHFRCAVAADVLGAVASGHAVDIAGNLSVLVPKFVLFHPDAAGVPPGNRYCCLEVRLLVNIAHHLPWFQEVVRALEAGRAQLADQAWGSTLRGCESLQLLLLSKRCLRGKGGCRHAREVELPRLVIRLHFLLQVLRVFLVTRHLLLRKECLSSVLESVHETFGLEV